MTTQASLAFRENLAKLISPLRRVRPRVPFYQLAAHRIPTLWSLYRGLLKEACTEDIKLHVKALFRRSQHLTSTAATKKLLLKGYKLLDTLRLAKQGDEHSRVLLNRYSALIAIKRSKAYWIKLARTELLWQKKLRNRPILTGGFLRPSLYNKPLPRLKPQPLAITFIIAKRRAAREKRQEQLHKLQDALEDLQIETEFEEGLKELVQGKHQFQTVFGGEYCTDWQRPIGDATRDIYDTFRRDTIRSLIPYDPEMLEAIKRARREKITNKTRERERERRGEILPRTVRRMNQGPPAHILARMTPEEKHMDKVVRHVSEVGYVGQVKRKLGFRLKDPEAWRAEIGKKEDKKRLDAMLEMVNRENERRREWEGRKETEILA